MSPDLDEHIVRLMNRRAVIAPLLYLGAVLVSIVNARITLGIYAAIPILYILPSHIDRHLGKPPDHPDHHH